MPLTNDITQPATCFLHLLTRLIMSMALGGSAPDISKLPTEWEGCLASPGYAGVTAILMCEASHVRVRVRLSS